MHMLRRQSRRTASKTPSHSESLRGAAQSQPPLMRSRLTTPAPPCVLHSSPSQLPRLTQSIQATSNHVCALAPSLPLFVHRYSASATKSALDYPKHLAGWAHGGSEKRGRLLWLRLVGDRGEVVSTGGIMSDTQALFTCFIAVGTLSCSFKLQQTLSRSSFCGSRFNVPMAP